MKHAVLVACALATCGTVASAESRAIECPQREEGPPIGYVPTDGSGWIKIKKSRWGGVYFRVMINGVPATALVDTGSPTTILDKTFAQRLASQIPGKALESDQNKNVWLSAPVSVTIGKLRYDLGEFVQATDLVYVSTNTIKPDLVLGYYPLKWLAWEVDSDRERTRFACGTSMQVRHDLRVEEDDGLYRFMTTVGVNGGDVHDLAIDTGNDGDLDLLLQPGITARLRVVTDLESDWIWGSDVAPLALAHTLTIGNYTKADRTVLEYKELPPQLRNGLLGMGLLREFNFILNGPEGWLQLTPRRGKLPAPRRSTTGIQVTRLQNGWRIDHLMMNSPAAASSLKTGQVICRINGHNVSGLRRDLDRMERPPAGAKLSIETCDGRRAQFVATRFF